MSSFTGIGIAGRPYNSVSTTVLHCDGQWQTIAHQNICSRTENYPQYLNTPRAACKLPRVQLQRGLSIPFRSDSRSQYPVCCLFRSCMDSMVSPIWMSMRSRGLWENCVQHMTLIRPNLHAKPPDVPLEGAKLFGNDRITDSDMAYRPIFQLLDK